MLLLLLGAGSGTTEVAEVPTSLLLSSSSPAVMAGPRSFLRSLRICRRLWLTPFERFDFA